MGLVGEHTRTDSFFLEHHLVEKVGVPSLRTQAVIESLGYAQECGFDGRVRALQDLRNHDPLCTIRDGARLQGRRAFVEEALHVVEHSKGKEIMSYGEPTR